MSKKKNLTILIIIVAIIAIVWIVWSKTASPTKIALVNFQSFQNTSIIRSNTDNFVKYKVVSTDDINKLSRYDFVLVFGMGLNITAEQREKINEMAAKGTPILIYAATSPENNICNLDSITKASVLDYLDNGNKKTYQQLARYIRKDIDQKRFFVEEPEPFVESASDVLYHVDENVAFTNVFDYENYLKTNGFYKENAPKAAIVGGMNDPYSGNKENLDSLIIALQNSGLNVYPVSSFMKRLFFLKEIEPDAVIYFAHGRMMMGQPEAGVEWLKAQNIPIFSPLTILQSQEEWEADPMGMMGGFMSQSVVMPELDGAIYPYVLNAQKVDKDGLSLFVTIPERLKGFTEIINNFITLKRKNNSEKKIAIYYFKGPGQSTLTAQGLETIPSLYNFLKRLKTEGYKVGNLPANEKDFETLLMTQGSVLTPYAEGSFDDYLKNGNPALIEKSKYESWVSKSMPASLYQDVVNIYGEAPGKYMAVNKDNNSYLAVARIVLGNIALLPQPMAGLGSDEFAIVHGTKSAPPHTYIAAYLWTHNEFKADAMLHFGTHGSLEFTPFKQIALSNYDWPDRLVQNTPHFYYYTIGNIGECMMAKRRSYASVVSYLTPAFMETKTRSQFKELQSAIQNYYKSSSNEVQEKYAKEVKKLTIKMGIHRDLRLDSTSSALYTMEEIEKIENFAEEIANEKMTGHLYTSGIPYPKDKIQSTVQAISADPIAYSIANLDKLNGKITEEQFKNKAFFTRIYLNPAKVLVNRVLSGTTVNNQLICNAAGISEKELAQAKKVLAPKQSEMMKAMMEMMKNDDEQPVSTPKAKSGGGHPSWIPKDGKMPKEVKKMIEEKKEKDPSSTENNHSKEMMTKTDTTVKKISEKMPQIAVQEYSAEEKQKARAIVEIEKTINNIISYKNALEQSPEMEFKGLLNALSGGYTPPSSGGDAVANPSAIPTGRNLYAINAESTPSEIAWENGVALVKSTLEQYQKQHGEFPRKVSYTFWSSEFIETQGATIAQVLYMLGVEPVRDSYGRVSDLQLISSETLGRPRIDIVVQTSGQFRDLAASRLALISRAVEMAAAAKDDKFENFVSKSVIETEKSLVEQGIPPKDARELSAQRIFGGVNGNYGTGIQGMVAGGDRWESEAEIAEIYIKNMGAIYGSDKTWGNYQEGLLHSVLQNTDVVVQPRQSNTWGALSLDHVYEFMGGMNLAVRNVTGKDPDAYFADYRNRNNMKMQDIKEAIGVEARSTIFNPTYVKEVMNGNASSASQITEVISNTYGWNVMKPNVIDDEMWNKIYDVYVKDEFNLGTEKFFRNKNPYALQEISAVMMETARKGMWKATDQQLTAVANLHTELVKDYGFSGSGFVGNNTKLQNFIAQNVNQQNATAYKSQIKKTQVASSQSDNVGNGMVLSKQEMTQQQDGEQNSLNGILIVSIVLVAFIVLLILLKRRKK